MKEWFAIKILYASCACSNQKINQLYNNGGAFAAQKYHNLLANGLVSNEGVKVNMITSLPISRRSNKKIFWGYESEKINESLQYHYMPFINVPIFRHVFIFVSALIFCLRYIVKEKDINNKIVICDILNISISVAAFLAARFCGGKSIAIITDIPSFMQYKLKENIIKNALYKVINKIIEFFMKNYDSYILLTQQMNKFVNIYKCPYIIIEGMVDHSMRIINNNIKDKFVPKVIMYAGVLYDSYGVNILLQAFNKLENQDVNLWIYGSGELSYQIKEFEKKDSRIKFFGTRPNKLVVNDEIHSTLLVNPRPSINEFTKYSFPSKNLEYMVSGTPVLTTNLLGMPEEYKDHVYLIENETIEGIYEKIKELLSKSSLELHEKGLKAKEFVLKEKNNIVQAKLVISFIESLIDKDL